MNRKNTAASGKLIKAVYGLYVCVYMTVVIFLSEHDGEFHNLHSAIDSHRHDSHKADSA